MKIGGAYIRVSTDDQLEYSPDSQLAKIKEYASKNDIFIPKEFIFMEEDGKSGRNAENRPEFQKMIAFAKTKPKPFDVVLVWKFSRFARNREDSIVYKSMLRKQCGIDIISVSENIGDDKMSVLIEAIIEAMDEWYSINLAEEVIRGMWEKVSRGENITAAPFGYIIEEKSLKIEEFEADIVRQIFKRYAIGQGYKQIALWLNAMGIKTKRGNPFEVRTVKYILENRVYIGEVKLKQKKDGKFIVSKGKHTPIITEDLWNTIKVKREKNKKDFIYNANTSVDISVLKGLIRCSQCGSTLIKCGKGLQCGSYSKGLCSSSHYISSEKLTNLILREIGEFLKGYTIEIRIKEGVKLDAITDIKALEQQIVREKSKLDRVKSAFEEGIDTKAEYRENKGRITNIIENLEKEKEKISANYKVPSKNKERNVKVSIYKLLFGDIPKEDKNIILKSIIEKIIFVRTDREDRFQIIFRDV